MKIFPIITFLFISVNAVAQTGTCENPKGVCIDEFGSFLFDNTGSSCYGGNSKIYFSFNTKSDFSLPYTLPNQSDVFRMGYYAHLNGQALNSTYKIYGPFDLNENSCDLISTYSAAILSQGVVNQTTIFDIPNSFVANKRYVWEIIVEGCVGALSLQVPNIPALGYNDLIQCVPDVPCENCIPKFQPTVGEYIISAWVKQEGVPAGTTSYVGPEIQVIAGHDPDYPLNGVVTQVATPSGKIIDGWQKIEKKIFVTDETSFEVKLLSTFDGTTYFDDIRIYPNDGSAMTYVYDPITLRLMAELDERNYATLYEYDEEGKLIRIKKETEKGIMTIQENRDNNSLKP